MSYERVLLPVSGKQSGERALKALSQARKLDPKEIILLHAVAPSVGSPMPNIMRDQQDIAVKAAFEVADDFNAIGSCVKKEYTYRIYNSRIKNPFYVNRAYFYPKKLDEAVMDRAARMFEGTHDFAAVRSVGTNVRSTVRTIYYCRVTRNEELLELKVCANGFLYNMVRAITGTVLYAAEGKLAPEDIPVILDSGNRTLAGPTAPPGGLYLTRVWYDDERLER